VARTFVRETYASEHAFASEAEENAALIDFRVPVFTGNDPKQSHPDEQTFYFS
jgi:hypothetical protein